MSEKLNTNMEYKTVKFRDHLARMILAGEKNSTWRLFDDKNLQEGDTLALVNWNTGEEFAKATIVDMYEKKIKDFKEKDFDGHEKFTSDEEMYKAYRTYYGDTVGPDTIVKIIHFKLL